MLPVKRFYWDTPQYADAFATLLKCTGERVYVYQILRGIFSNYPPESRAIDWGAGSGDLTSLMLEHFRCVYAVEPHPGMRAVLAARCPRAQIFDGTIMSTTPPTKVEVGLISHVFYHIPDHKWGAHTIHAANQLTQDGVLIVTLKDPDSGCNQMIEYFGAPRYDIYDSLSRVIRLHKEFDFSFTRGPGSISTTSFDDTLKIARFMFATETPTPSPVTRRRKNFKSMFAVISGMRRKAQVVGAMKWCSASYGEIRCMQSNLEPSRGEVAGILKNCICLAISSRNSYTLRQRNNLWNNPCFSKWLNSNEAPHFIALRFFNVFSQFNGEGGSPTGDFHPPISKHGATSN